MNSRTKQHRRWGKELKQYLMGDLGIDFCESCGTSYGLSIMHATKRREIQTKADYFRAVIVCLPEHQSYDEATGDDPHSKMAAFVDGLIAKRTYFTDGTLVITDENGFITN